MPLYITLDDVRVGTLTTADMLNQIRENMNTIAQPPLEFYEHPVGGGDYSTTAQQFMVPIDSTNMKFTIETFRGGHIIAVLSGGMVNTDPNGPAFGLSFDGNLLDRHGEYGAVAPYLNTESLGVNNAVNFTLIMTVHNVNPGEHTVEPIWAANPDNNPTGTVALYDDWGIFFGVWER